MWFHLCLRFVFPSVLFDSLTCVSRSNGSVDKSISNASKTHMFWLMWWTCLRAVPQNAQDTMNTVFVDPNYDECECPVPVKIKIKWFGCYLNLMFFCYDFFLIMINVNAHDHMMIMRCTLSNAMPALFLKCIALF